MKKLLTLPALALISFQIMAAIHVLQELPAGMTYQLQFGPYSFEMERTLDNLIHPLTFKADVEGAFYYRGGIYRNAYDASLDLNHLRFEGIDHITVVAFFNGQPVSLSDAAAFEDNRNELESAFDLDALVIPELLPQESFYYTVSVVVNSFDMADRLLDFAEETRYTITYLGSQRYNIGHIADHSEAVALRLSLACHGISDATVASFYGEKEVSIYLADILEEISTDQGLESNNR